MSSESKQKLFSLVTLIASLCMVSNFLWAQDTRGTISGRVTDPSNSVIPGTHVTATEKSSNLSNTTLTNSDGYYELPRLNVGFYQVKLEIAGFKTRIIEDVEVRIQENVRLDVMMEVGNVSETVVVKGEAPLLDMASASIGTIIGGERIRDLPIGHGNPTFLMYLAPGVTIAGLGRDTQRFQRSSTAIMRINGSPAGTTDYLIDGAPNTQVGNGLRGVSFHPMSDVVQEMKVQTGDFDASVGHSGGSAVNVGLKSGTNEFHGTAYKYFRTSGLNANDFFANRVGRPIGNFEYGRYGFSVGGPVRITKLYNGRNRTFFMYGFDHLRQSFPLAATGTVPTAKELQGDFSDLLALGPQYQIYDPLTIRSAPNGRFSIEPFQGNIIPDTRIDPIAKKLAALWPAPNQPGGKDGVDNLNYPFYAGNPRTDYASTIRVDHQLTAGHRLAGSAIISQTVIPFSSFLGRKDIAPDQVTGTPRHYSVSDTWVINPHWVASIRLSNMRFSWVSEPLGRGIDQASLGFDSRVLRLVNNTNRVPAISVGGFDFLRATGDGYNISDTWSLGIHLNAIKGSHSFKFGSDLRLYRIYEGNNPFLSVTFDSTYTRGPFDNSPPAPIGQALAAFLLGIPSSGNITLSAQTAERVTFQGFYFQDDWKATPNLTLSFGLRYEREGPLSERNNQSVRGFDFGAANPLEAQARANYAKDPIPQIPVDQFRVGGGLLFAGVGGQPKNLYNSDNNNLQPRIGFAHRLARNTVVRGGYGIFMIPLAQRFVGLAPVPLGFSQSTLVVPTLDNGQTFIASLANPFPNGLLQPAGSSKGLLTEVGRSIQFFSSNLVNPYNQRWQFSVQQELARTVFEVGYVGNRTTRMLNTRDINALPDSWLSRSGERDPATINLLTSQVTNPFFGLLPGTALAGQNVSRSQLLLPFPEFLSISTWNNQGYTNYHALRAQVERRFQAGFTLLAGFNRSKLIEGVSYLNAGDLLPEKAISARDAPTSFTTSAIYELPFGPGKPLGSSTRGVLGRVIGGWQIQGILERQTGFPVDWGNVLFRGNIKGIPISERTPDRWFNTDAGFERNSAKQLQLNLRTFPSRLSAVRADTNLFLDLSVSKKTALKENVSVVFYAEAYDAFNHPVFAAPNTNPASSAFGTVNAVINIPREVQFGLKLFF